MAKAASAAVQRRVSGQPMGLAWRHPLAVRLRGAVMAAFGLMLVLALASYDPADPSLNASSALPPVNLLGRFGANLADLAMQSLGLASWLIAAAAILGGLSKASGRSGRRASLWAPVLALLALAGALSAPAPPAVWPLAKGLGGFWGEAVLSGLSTLFAFVGLPDAKWAAAGLLGLIALGAGAFVAGLKWRDFAESAGWLAGALRRAPADAAPAKPARAARKQAERAQPLRLPDDDDTRPPELEDEDDDEIETHVGPAPLVHNLKAPKTSRREDRENQGAFAFVAQPGFKLPELNMLAKAKPRAATADEAALLQNARLLEAVLAEFGVNGRIDQIRPGPVVTLYELVPAPGVKTARVVALADDIARSMSVISCRVSVAPGRSR